MPLKSLFMFTIYWKISDMTFLLRTNVMDFANDLTAAKKREIQRLTALLQRVSKFQ